MKKIIPLSAVLLALTGLWTGGPAAHAETPPAPAVQEHHIYIHITPSPEGIQVTVHDGAAPVAEPPDGEATEAETPVAEPEPEAEPVDVEPATEPEETEPEAEPVVAVDEPAEPVADVEPGPDDPAAVAEIIFAPPEPPADQPALVPATICRIAHGPSLLLEEEPAAAKPPMGLLLFIFVLAIFLGFELIAKVPSQLHTPLMSGSNAISGITIVGALAAAGLGVGGAFGTLLGTLAVAFAAINVVGGYMVTNRMLAMFKKKDGGAQ